MNPASPEARTALQLIVVLQRELAGTRKLAIVALGVASTAIGAVVACVAL